MTNSEIKAFIETNQYCEMVKVESGSFRRGDKNQYTVNITKDFEIGKYLVTQELWQAVMNNNPSSFKGDKRPVEQVTWNDTQEFIKKLNIATGQNYALPTEAQWEFAAKGGVNKNDYNYSGSNLFENIGWFINNSHNETKNVGMKQPNTLGIYDMSGNVWEWCKDIYDLNFYNKCNLNDPESDGEGSFRILRGGSWSGSAVYCTIANRHDYHCGLSFNFIGFRLVRLFS
jgi:formylglycine-generating enzyme required for sulfatase activity